jgi:hypothetical protein
MMNLWRRCYFVACAAVLVDWVVYALAKDRVSIAIAARFGETLLRLSQGKFRDAGSFVQHRLYEALWLATLALVFVAAHWMLNCVVRTRIKRNQWAIQGLEGFVWLNLWIGAAMHTALFWGVMGAGAGVQNLMQFHLKRILAAENSVTNRAVLVGSSQTRAEIDEDLLNQLLGTNLWTTELHFPGSHGYDLLLIERQLQRVHPQIVICYVTEGYFYTGSRGETPPNFLSFSDIRDGWHRGAQHYLSNEEILSGLLGACMPLFRCREVLALRLLGSLTIQLKQQEYDTSLQRDLEARAREIAIEFRLSNESEFQKQAFEDFVARCQRTNRRVVLLLGGYNPLLARRIDPAIRTDMLNFLNQLQSRYSLVSLVPEADLVEQTRADYEDLSHVNQETQRRFTTALAKLLAGFLAENPAGGKLGESLSRER